MSRIRILVVDSQPLTRRAWCSLLAAHTDFEVIGEASSLAVAAEQAAAKSPDLIMVDFDLGPESGLDLQSRLERSRHNGNPVPKVMLLTRHEDAGHVRAALAAKVAGYVATSATEAEFVAAIRAIHAGRFVLHASSSAAFSAGGRDEPPVSVLDQLSDREREVLRGLAEGHTNKAIAARLGLSVKTVETYRARLCSKLRLQSRPELLQFSLRHGLLSIPPMMRGEPGPSKGHSEV
jgi:two-component system, NarL family, response regulator NreC